MYAVILAGGSGTRLWPRSRQRRPKQLLDLLGNDTLLQKTVARIQPLVPYERILIITGRDHADLVREQIPQLPQENILIEHQARGTGPCAGLAAVYLQRLVGDDIIIMLHADAFIEKEAKFRQILRAAATAAQEGHLVTVGIAPRYPETGFGYIQRGEIIAEVDGNKVYQVRRFTEKPDYATAQQFVASGEYYWNSGIFIWKISSILAEFERCQPDLSKQLFQIQKAWGEPNEKISPQGEETIRRIWESITPQTIDVGIMEQARDVVVIPADIGWSDIGSWASLADILCANSDGNIILGNCSHVGLDTHDSLIYSPHRLVATIGLNDIIIVDTDDAILVCAKERAQEVKKLVEKLREKGYEKYC